MIRRFFERSLFTQVITIFFGVLIFFVLLIFAMLRTNLAFTVFPEGLGRNANALSELVALIESVDDSRRSEVLSTYSGSFRWARIGTSFPATAETDKRLFNLLKDDASSSLANRDVRFRKYMPVDDPDAQVRLTTLEVSIRLEDGNVLFVWLTPLAIMNNPQLGPIPAMVLLFLGLTVLTIFLLRHTFRPLKALESAAINFGDTLEPRMIDETGTDEIRRLSRSFNKMQSQIRRLIEERTNIMAAVSHDVRTGLTRLRLRLDKHEVVDPNIESDLHQIGLLVDDMMTFITAAKTVSNEIQVVELECWLNRYVNDSPYRILWQPCDVPSSTLAVSERALRRCLDNLVDNANRYAGECEISLLETDGELVVEVRDRGPGVPVDEINELFTPFHRLESSRSRETGGTGLGLGIARELIRADGGDVTLANADSGGLIVRIRFPEARRVPES